LNIAYRGKLFDEFTVQSWQSEVFSQQFNVVQGRN